LSAARSARSTAKPAAKSPDTATPAAVPGGFRLAAPLAPYDPRITPIRGDLADLALAGRFFTPHYVEPQQRRCLAARTPVRAAPSHAATAVTELLFGEQFAVLDTAGGWCWGYCRLDGYCGYVAADTLGEQGGVATHIVHGRAALVFAEPSIKAPVATTLPMGARLAVTGASEDDCFLATAHGFVSRRHLHSLDDLAFDPVERAQLLTGAPYLWGGRSGDGLDCSGLVQLVLALAGGDAPRDSDQQLEALGAFLDEDAPLRRGDLVFFPGHVGIMADADRLVHANAHWMAVVTEPLADVIARFPAETPDPVLARKRLAA